MGSLDVVIKIALTSLVTLGVSSLLLYFVGKDDSRFKVVETVGTIGFTVSAFILFICLIAGIWVS